MDDLTKEELHMIECALAFYIEEFSEGTDLRAMEDLNAKIQKALWLRHPDRKTEKPK
jgi:hypothetical protein